MAGWNDDYSFSNFWFSHALSKRYFVSNATPHNTAIHELGHSLGFQHSGIEDNIYADKTGYMGYAVNQIGTPRKSFVSVLVAIAPHSHLAFPVPLLSRSPMHTRTQKIMIVNWFFRMRTNIG